MAALVNGLPIVVEGKHPAEVIRLQLDWTEFAEGEAISTSAWVDARPASGLLLGSEQMNGFRTGVLVEGGIDGAEGYVENRVAFVDGRCAVITFQIIVSSRLPA